MASGYEKHECGVDPAQGWGTMTPREAQVWWVVDRVVLVAGWGLLGLKAVLVARFLGL